MTWYLNWPGPTIIEDSFRASIRDRSIATASATRKLLAHHLTLLGQCLLPMLSGEAEENRSKRRSRNALRRK
jgi:hypothetical protein